MTIAAMEPVESTSGDVTPDYNQIYTLLSRVMRGQPPPNLSPLDARVILDLLNDQESRLRSYDIRSQVHFVTNKYKEVMGEYQPDTSTGRQPVTSTGRQLRPRRAKKNVSGEPEGDGKTATTSGKPRTQLFSLNPLNVPVQMLNLKRQVPVHVSQSTPLN